MTTENQYEDAALVSQPKDLVASVVENAIAEMEKLAKSLDKARSLMIARTIPGDWIKMGNSVYLEGDGALRIAPLLGLEIKRVRLTQETKDSGAIEITYTADFSSKLFGTIFADVSRSRAQDDDFLMKKGEFADLPDVRSAAYKGMIARGVQLVGGLSGLTPEDMKSKYGFDVSSGASVDFKTGKADVKKADQTAAADGQKEVARILHKVFMGNEKAAADWLEKATEKKGEGGWPGKRDPMKLTAAGVKYTLPKLEAMERDFDESLKNEGGGGE